MTARTARAASTTPATARAKMVAEATRPVDLQRRPLLRGPLLHRARLRRSLLRPVPDRHDQQGLRGDIAAHHPEALSGQRHHPEGVDRKSTRLNSSHVAISYAVF